ncbi:MAG: MFS transporter [Selenomonadaceae bacterium]|nr:MFS transporter [Selenomonadaceae bacterium]
MSTATPNVSPAMDERLSWFTRICYGFGDTACNVVAGAMTILTFFYTDYAGVEPTTVGLVMLLSRCFDGVSDVIMGFIVERTNSKWGKSRPWVLWSSIPFCVSIVLIYCVPQGVSDFTQFVYLFITYNFCNTVCYTALNLPYGSLSAMMTRSSHERDMLSVTRMALSPIGKIISISATLPLIKVFGDNQTAWIIVMSIWAVLALFLLLLCFKQCEEKVVIEARKKEDKLPVGRAIKCLLMNKYFLMAAFIWMMQCIIQMVTGTVLPYYCKYIFFDDSLFSYLLLLEVVTTIVTTVLFCPFLLRKFGKRNMSMIGCAVALIGHLIYCTHPTDFNWVIFSCFIRGVGFAPLNSVIFGFLGDCVEYGQYKFHLRTEGLIFSGGSIGYKLGTGLCGAFITWLMSMSGYVASTTANAVQPQSAIDMIVNIYIFGMIIIWVSLLIVLSMYKLDKEYPAIMEELSRREARGEM